MTRCLVCVFISIQSFFCFAQKERLTGKILADSLHGAAIHIVNYTQELGTTSDAYGFFEIPARPGDSIVFSSIQYESVSKVVSSADLQNPNFLVRLVPIVNQLEEVRINNTNLSGNILKDAKTIELSPFVNNQSLGLPFKDIEQPTVAERRLYTATSAKFDLLLNVLSGRLKKLKKLKKIEALEEILMDAEHSFARSFFMYDLKIPKELISDFIYFCSHDPDFETLLENSKKLSLLEFFQKKAEVYKKDKKIED